MNQQTITGTLVIIAPKNVLDHDIRDAVTQAVTVHQGPVIVLPHNWSALPAESIRAQLDAAESIGPSKPPPPPPPPAASDLVCPKCSKGPRGHSIVETMPPCVKWCDGTESNWDTYPNE
jgi:hypothetical protein